MIAAGGVVWILSIASKQLQAAGIQIPSGGPIEVTAAGIVIWLHAKWRGSVRHV